MCDLHRMLSIKEDVADGACKTRDEIKIYIRHFGKETLHENTIWDSWTQMTR